ncbi:hypothetical protein KR51_00015650 [Rubidibacter lacunae KORDI 51-2]|uniref:Uncharacterized protein n=1 Tax=Rubidibacter lacunae KORDI 51-2 TaxID=582515 RepID=U5DMA5_9CHRO|nr:hypothetical protein [Rubidibacter lacunae]ERN41719.1 hypothetical protein KR51_00015650 [Rubidibacter lacunae KORDI 51-2]
MIVSGGSNTVRETVRIAKTERLNTLAREYVNCNRQLQCSDNNVARSRLNCQLQNIEQQMMAVESELEELDSASQDSNRCQLILDENLPKIDFKAAIQRVQGIFKGFPPEGGAALFLVQNSLPFMGDLLVKEIKDCLSKSTRDFRVYPVSFSPGSGLDQLTFLHRIADQLGVGVSERVECKKKYVESIVEKICGSLRTGSTIFFEFSQWDNVPSTAQPELLAWLIQDFWHYLERRLRDTANKWRKIRIVGTIVVDGMIAEGCTQSVAFCNDVDKFDMKNLFELPLEQWLESDIADWLGSFSDLPADTIDAIARRIYRASLGGMPCLICEALRKEPQLKQTKIR